MDWRFDNNDSTTMEGPTSTIHTPVSSYPTYVGYICCLIAVIFYGSNFVPVKKFKTGDGIFFQWILSSGIFLVGLVIQIVQESKFYPIVMIGGLLWSTGNLCVVPIFKSIGMGLGMSIWGTFGLVTGWASGKFGWFDTPADEIHKPAMNYAGVGLALLSILVYMLVKTEVSSNTEMEISVTEQDPLLQHSTSSVNAGQSNYGHQSQPRTNLTDVLVFNKTESGESFKKVDDEEEPDEPMFFEHFSPRRKKVIGYALSVVSGFMYGINFMPAIVIMKNHSDSSKNGLDYVFAHFCGIYAASTFYFCVYCAVKKNRPKVFPRAIFPGIVSGIMWGIATSCWYIANAVLSESVAFPIISTAPAGIASLFWGVFVFHEIKGRRNILLLLCAFSIMGSGSFLAGLSKSL